MKALVTGGAGLIGSHIAEQLLERGDDVCILDNLQEPTHLPGVPPYIPEGAEFIKGDVRSKEDLHRSLQGVDLVFHQAAYGGFMPDISRYFHVNAVGTANIIELIRDYDYPVKKLVVASSQAIYGEGKYHCPEHGEIYPDMRPIEQLLRCDWEAHCPHCGLPLIPLPTDEARIEPKTAYAISKYSQEAIVLSLGEFYGLPVVGLRYSLTYGPRQSLTTPYTGICSIFSTRLLNHLPIIIYEDGQQMRDFIYVGDVAAANILVAERDEANYQVYNVGTGMGTSINQFVHTLGRVLGEPVTLQCENSFRPGEVRHLFADSTRLRALGWRPATSLEAGLARYVAWIKTKSDVRDYFTESERLMRQMQVVRESYAA